jgi:hypothetical protein
LKRAPSVGLILFVAWLGWVFDIMDSALFAFAKASGVKVIYCLRLLHADPAESARTVNYITDHYDSLLDCFTIGQEPTSYPAGKPLGEGADRMDASNLRYTYDAFARGWLRGGDRTHGSLREARRTKRLQRSRLAEAIHG